MSLTRTLKSIFIGTYPAQSTRASSLTKTSIADPADWLVSAYSAQTNSGVSVSSLDCMRSAAVLCCVRVLSETIASLPLVIYQSSSDGNKRKATDHYLYNLLHYQVNPLMTTFEWREVVMQHLAIWGNHYSEIERNNAGEPIALWSLRPDRMRVTADGLQLRYFYTLPEGRTVEIPSDNIHHIKGLSSNGLIGQSIIQFARESVGIGLAMEEFTARFFSNDATPRTFLKHPGQLTDKSRENLRESIERMNRGLEKKFRMQILEEGMDIATVGMPLEDAQFIELRKFTELDIFKVFRIPPHMGGILDRATFSNIEHQAIEFVVHTIRPWLVRIEQAFQRDLFFEDELGRFYARFIVDGLLRGDTKSRFEAYSIGRQWGWYSIDEIRELEDLNPLPNGKGQQYIVPLNFAPVNAKPQQVEPTAQQVIEKPNGNAFSMEIINSEDSNYEN